MADSKDAGDVCIAVAFFAQRVAELEYVLQEAAQQLGAAIESHREKETALSEARKAYEVIAARVTVKP